MMKKQSLTVGYMICLALFMNACATFKKPAAINEAPINERALTKESKGIRASAAVLGDEEARQIFGIDLARKKIQAVWIALENNTDKPVLLLPTAIDPDYFAPLEAAFAYHKFLADDANAALDEHLKNLNFPIRSLIGPGSRASGYILTNWKKGMKVVDIDLSGDNFSQNFTIFAPNPDSTQGQDIINRSDKLFSTAELQVVETEAALRKALEQLPCCVSNEKGGTSAEPLNVVIIGAMDDWTTAFVRRGYRYEVLNPRYAFGRFQDISGRKLSRGYTKAQGHTIRIWQTPIRYHGKPVWVAQTSVRMGGRFSDIASAEVTLPLNPHIDEARDDLTQDLVYSQALKKMGFIKGSGRPQLSSVEKVSEDVHYTTDGLRVILEFAHRPASLADIDFFDWEQLADYR
ncbi:MAG: LssY C-terminal domain-containing protein [Desulfobacterales bacterium]